MKGGEYCYLMVATNTKLVWQSDNIVVKVDLFYVNERLGNGKGCRNHEDNIKVYENGREITVVSDNDPESDSVCMVKYIIQNKSAS